MLPTKKPLVPGIAGKEGDKEDTTVTGILELQCNKKPRTMAKGSDAKIERRTSHSAKRLNYDCQTLLKLLSAQQDSWIFQVPVDPVALQLPGYFDIIKKPMDLGTIKQKLHDRQYRSLDEFSADVSLTFDNEMLYTEDGSEVHAIARELKAFFLVRKRAIVVKNLKKSFFGVVWLHLLFRKARTRANERLYVPGGRGYSSSKKRFETQVDLFKYVGKGKQHPGSLPM